MRTLSRLGRNSALITCVAAALSAAYPATASDVEAFYRGKTVAIVVSTGPGGPYDLYARVLSRHIGRHIPGAPSVVVQSMPGAGGLRAANFLASGAPTDGTTIGTVQASVPFAPLLGEKAARFDPTRFNWLGSMNKEGSVCVAWHTAPVKTLKDALDHELVVGNTGPGSSMEMYPLMLNRLLGTRIRIVSGYQGGPSIYIAMERGEVQGRCGVDFSGLRSTKGEWLPDRKINIVVQTSLEPSDDPYIKGSPMALDLARNDEQRGVMRLLFSKDLLDKPFLAPPGVPADRVAALVKAFEAAVRDPALLADLKTSGLQINFVSGERVRQVIADAYNSPAAVTSAARAAAGSAGKP